MSKAPKKIVFSGNLMWAHLIRPTKDFNGNPCWSVEVECSEDAFSKLQDLSLSRRTRLKSYEDKTYLKLMLPQYRKDNGGENKAPVVVDENESHITTSIGNGSVGKVICSCYSYNNRHGSGIVIRPEKVIISDLVEYAPDSDNSDVLDLGSNNPSDPF